MQELKEADRNIAIFGTHIDLGIWLDSFRRAEHERIESAKIVTRQILMKSGARLQLISGPNSKEEAWMWRGRLSGLQYNTVYFLPGLSQESIEFGLTRLRGNRDLIARWLPSKEYERN